MITETSFISARDNSMRKTELEKSTGYQHLVHDPEWVKKWGQEQVYQTGQDPNKANTYILDMFPYPSGYGLHVGHVEGYTATDIFARYKRMKGFNVLHPMGWDAFGLPTENFAIRTGQDPANVTRINTDVFRDQCNKTGLSYDWEREVDTSSPKYYKWTQEIFLKLYKADLAYKDKAPVNWCPSCQTVISDAQAKGGLCERCSSTVETKKIDQWFFKTTAYVERLLEDLNDVNWPESSKEGQRNWIGRSEGHEVTFAIDGQDKKLKVFTTKVGTIHGTTFMAIAPESPYVDSLVTDEYKDAVTNYVKNISPQSEQERKKSEKEKTGVFTGSFAINPINGEKIPVWVADYVLMDYGTGAVMGVPSLDKRDLDFAQTYNLDIVDLPENLLLEDGVKRTLESLGESANAQVQYKLRDWLVSRERFWGAPIPIVYCESCGIQPVKEDQLPVLLPTDLVDYKPTGHAPLEGSKSFMETTCPECDGPAQREAKTLDTFVCSSWYFLRFCDPHNGEELASKEAIKKWMPVETYVGGAEHIAGHLLYSRFISKALKDLGVFDINEPFQHLVHPGIILGEDGQKMSKSQRNVVTPDEQIEKYGADTLRMYEMFLGPLTQSKPWDSKGIVGVRRFIDRVNSLKDKLASDQEPDRDIISLTDNLVYTIGRDIEDLKLNTPVSEFMKYVSAVEDKGSIDRRSFERFLLVMAPFAPFITEQLWSEIGNGFSIHQQDWPALESQEIISSGNKIPLQIDGKLGETLEVPEGFTGSSEDILNLIAASPKLAAKINDETIGKIIYKEGVVINIATKKRLAEIAAEKEAKRLRAEENKKK